MSHLDPALATRLAKILGMLGSAHDGERAAAGAKADALLKQHGLRWADFIAPQPCEQTRQEHRHQQRHERGRYPDVNMLDIYERIDECLECPHALNEWELGFLQSIRKQRRLSAKQLAKLDQIIAEVRAYRGGRP